MKNSNDAIGDQTCNLPACSAVPQTTAPPRAPSRLVTLHKLTAGPVKVCSYHLLQVHLCYFSNTLFVPEMSSDFIF